MKRALDFVAALIGLVLTAPLVLVLAVLIRLRLGTPVFFRQQRPGFRGRPFILV
jgi:lipopolysaccharide/colanic/teichoic acid biosynthesis glycosyltransferase